MPNFFAESRLAEDNDDNHPYRDGQLPYRFHTVEDYWPRRLLHIKTRKSIVRHTSNEYQDPESGEVHREPRFSILTYTWGRWELKRQGKTGPALEVHTDWEIPAIDPEHFTVDAFDKVITALGAGGTIQWVWLDVACIDQREESPDMAEEIGHQASIFNKAARVYAWLSHLSTAELASSTAGITEYGLEIRDHIDCGKTGSDNALHESTAHLKAALQTFFSDPWFSSLWTLQEIVLARDAIALSREAEAVRWDKDHYLFFVMIINVCQNIYQDMQDLERKARQSTQRSMYSQAMAAPPDPHAATLAADVGFIKDLLLRAGFYYLFSDNPNVQYGTAKYRQTLRDEDRIYAITQIYNLKVGKSARPTQDPSLHPKLDELQIEFAAAINQRCPILGQFFSHTSELVPENTWCITTSSTVPDHLMTYRDPRPQCQFLPHGLGVAKVRGRYCQLFELYNLLKKSRADNSSDTFELFLDQYVLKALHYRPEFAAKVRLGWDNSFCIPGLNETCGRQNMSVILLGDLKGVPSPERKDLQRIRFGLLVSQVKPGGVPHLEEQRDAFYYRYGVCSWMEYSMQVEERVNQLPWVDGDLLLH
ncbi:hypothetical protein RB595_004159 [Gaeumannomyces hyphopodioides]